MPADSAAPLYEGRWMVRRLAIDYLARSSYRFAGTATIDGGSFAETGTVSLGANEFPATRQYDLVAKDTGIEVFFADGRPFIMLAAMPDQRVHHLCGADDYRGRFFFRGNDEWAERWRVIGPRKNYASLSLYRRMA